VNPDLDPGAVLMIKTNKMLQVKKFQILFLKRSKGFQATGTGYIHQPPKIAFTTSKHEISHFFAGIF
jgi:hypothetical protein